MALQAHSHADTRGDPAATRWTVYRTGTDESRWSTTAGRWVGEVGA